MGRKALEAHYALRDNTELIAQFPNQVIPARLINRWLRSKGAPLPPPTGEAWGSPAENDPAQENEEEAPAWGNTEIERISAVRLDEPGFLDNASLDRISRVAGAGLSQAPLELTRESVIQASQWVVAAESFRSQ